MAPSFLRFTVASMLASEAIGARMHKPTNKQKDGVESSSEPVQVDGLYTWGAPATAMAPGLKNARGRDGCFPGLRTATVQSPLLVNYVDTIVLLARPFGFNHPRMSVAALDVRSNTSQVTECSDEAVGSPSGLPLLGMHLPSRYVFHLDNHTDNDWLYQLSFMGCYVANVKDFPIVGGMVEDLVRTVGWRLAARAYAPGGFIQGGDQYSMLVQHPQTLDCFMTFQATLSVGDVWTDVDIRRTEWCGLPVRVHRGFRDHLMRMIEGAEWQRHIRPKLPFCNKVYVGGHSLGGANSELFTSCVQNAPANNEDYQALRWVKGQPQRIY